MPLLKCILFLALLSIGYAALDIKMTLLPSTLITVNITFTNPTKQAISVLNWFTPLEGVRSDMFVVADKLGAPMLYTGMMVRRGAVPLKEEYTIIDAGMTVWAVVDVWANYNFTKSGYYTVTINLPEEVGNCDQVVEAFVSSSTLPSGGVSSSVGAYTNCAANQISIIESSVGTSISQSKRAYDCMYAGSCDALSVRWFGVYSASNYNYDMGVFRNVNSRLNNYAFNAYCNPAGCGSNVYGYVYPTDSTFTVYLCGLFWSIPAERVNTIVHEMSHFSSLGGTQDYAYGQSNCLNLARTNPARASRNADNVCYFAEEA